MKTRPTPNQNSYSNDETDDETTMSQTDDETTDNELSQLLATPKTKFQKKIVRPRNSHPQHGRSTTSTTTPGAAAGRITNNGRDAAERSRPTWSLSARQHPSPFTAGHTVKDTSDTTKQRPRLSCTSPFTTAPGAAATKRRPRRGRTLT